MNPVQPGGFGKRLTSDWTYRLVFAAIIAMAAWLRLQQLGYDELWLDEAFTGFIALTHDWLAYLRIDNTPPLYYLLQRGWCGLLHCDAAGLRLSSVLAGVLFVVLAGHFCRRLYGRRIALAVALLAAVSPLHIYYSQEARVYALLMTVLLLVLYLQWRVINNGARLHRLLALFLACLTALFLHYFAIILIGIGLGVYALEALSGARRVPRGYFIAVGAALLVFMPWLYLSIFSPQATASELHWIADYLHGKPLWQLPLRSLSALLTGPQFHYQEVNLFMKRYARVELPFVVQMLNVFLVFLFLTLFLLISTRLRRLPRAQALLWLEVSALALLPLLALLFITLVIRPVYVVGRYDLIAYPGLLLLIGCMLQVLQQRAPAAKTLYRPALGAVLALLVAVQLYTVAAYRQLAPYGSLRPHAEAVLDQVQDGDALLIASADAIRYWYYLHAAGYDRRGDVCRGHGKQFACRLFPRDLEQAPASQQRYLDLYHTQRPSFDLGYVLHGLRPGARVLLLVEHLRLNGEQTELDPVGLQLVRQLQAAGYQRAGMRAVDKLLIFARNGAPR